MYVNKNVSGVSEDLSGNLEWFTIYTTFDYTPTGIYSDETQKYFDVINMTFGLRTQAILNSVPTPVADLAVAGAPTLTGAGFVCSYSSEHSGVFGKEVDGSYDEIYVFKELFKRLPIESLVIEYGVNFEVVRNEVL